MQTWQFLPCAFRVYVSFFIGAVCGGHDGSVLVPYRQVYEGVTYGGTLSHQRYEGVILVRIGTLSQP